MESYPQCHWKWDYNDCYKETKFADQCRSEHGILYYKFNDLDTVYILITDQSVEEVINDLLDKVGSPVRTPEAVKRQKTNRWITCRIHMRENICDTQDRPNKSINDAMNNLPNPRALKLPMQRVKPWNLLCSIPSCIVNHHDFLIYYTANLSFVLTMSHEMT